jgi:hypothetical protein
MVYNRMFEPIRTTAAVFDHVAEHKQFESLYSTRHFGPLVFHLCLTYQLDEFLVYSVLKGDLQSAANAVRVFLKVHTGRIYLEKILAGPHICTGICFSVADPGCLSRMIPVPNFSIPYPGSTRFRIADPDPHQRI